MWRTYPKIAFSERQNADFVKTGFTGRTDIILVRYSVTNNRLHTDNKLNFQGNVVRANRL